MLLFFWEEQQVVDIQNGTTDMDSLSYHHSRAPGTIDLITTATMIHIIPRLSLIN